jgi:hypothetical protein
VKQLRVQLVTTDSLVTNIKSNVTAAGVDIDAIITRANTLKTTTINGTTYTISGFPDTSSYSSANLPNLTGTPTISNWLSTIDGLPDLNATASSLNETFYSLRTNLSRTLNNSISGKIPNPANITSQFTGTINSTLDMVNSLITPIKTTVETNFFPLIDLGDMARNYASIGQFALVLLALVLSLFGVIFKRHRLMLLFPIVVVCFALLWWIQFIIYFLLSLPMNAICTSRASALGGSVTLPLVNAKIVPNALINSCSSGKNLFEASVNAEGDNVISVASDYVSSFILKVPLLSDNNSSSLVTLPSQNSSQAALKNASFSGFNTTGFSFPTKVSFNITALQVQIRNFNGTLTPALINPDLGNATTMQTKIDAFNAFCVSKSFTSFTPFTYSSIRTTYLVNNVTFDAADVSKNTDQNDQDNKDLYVLWGPVYQYTFFKFSADNNIATIQTNLTQIDAQLETLKSNRVATIETNLSGLNTTIDQISVTISTTTTYITGLGDDIGKMNTAVTSFFNAVIDDVKGIIRNGTSSLLNAVLVTNPVEGFAECKPLAEDTTYMLDSICIGTMNSAAGLWVSFGVVALVSIIGCIFGMRAKKRVDFMRKRSLMSKVGDKMQQNDDSLDSL